VPFSISVSRQAEEVPIYTTIVQFNPPGKSIFISCKIEIMPLGALRQLWLEQDIGKIEDLQNVE